MFRHLFRRPTRALEQSLLVLVLHQWFLRGQEEHKQELVKKPQSVRTASNANKHCRQQCLGYLMSLKNSSFECLDTTDSLSTLSG